MKHIRLIYMVIILLSQNSHAQEAMQLCYEDVDNFPWLVKNGRGLNNTLVDMASALSGVTTEQLAFPWKRCLHNIASGTVAGGLAASYSAERAEFAVYPTTPDGQLDSTRRLKTDGYSLYRRKGTTAHWDGQQFVNLTGPVGSLLGYSSAAELRKHGATVHESSDLPAVAMQHLLAGNLQLLALMTREGDEQLSNPELAGKVEKIPSPFVEKPYFVIFNKEFYRTHRKRVEQFWDGLAAARESDAFKKLLQEKMRRVSPIHLAR